MRSLSRSLDVVVVYVVVVFAYFSRKAFLFVPFDPLGVFRFVEPIRIECWERKRAISHSATLISCLFFASKEWQMRAPIALRALPRSVLKNGIQTRARRALEFPCVT